MGEDTKNESSAEKSATLLKFGEKEFDISTPEGLRDAQVWGEAISAAVGRQGHELGDLRKFKSERDLAANRNEVLAKVRKLREEGETEEADKLLFDHFEERELTQKKRQEIEAYNNELWLEYFTSQPKLVEFYGKDWIKSQAEKTFDLAQLDNPKESLNRLFAEQIKKVSQVSLMSDSQTPVIQSTAGGRVAPSRSTSSAKDSQEPVDFGALLDSVSAYKKD